MVKALITLTIAALILVPKVVPDIGISVDLIAAVRQLSRLEVGVLCFLAGLNIDLRPLWSKRGDKK